MHWPLLGQKPGRDNTNEYTSANYKSENAGEVSQVQCVLSKESLLQGANDTPN